MTLQLGMKLKDDIFVDFLESYDLSVTYDFDRLHEGQADSYYVECEDLGIDFRFDENRICRTIWIKEPGNSAVEELLAYPKLSSPQQVRQHAEENQLEVKEGDGWCRADGPSHCVHFQFSGDELEMVTLMDSSTAP